MENKQLVGIIATVITQIFWISPIKGVINLYKTHDTSAIPYLLYTFTIINCNCWVIYGFQLNEFPIWSANITGLICFLIFMTFYIAFQTIKLHNKIFLVSLLYFSVFSHFYCFYYYLTSDIVGKLALIANIIMFLSPIYQIYLALSTMNNKYIDFLINLATLLCSSIWVVYGILKDRNYNIIYPNVIGFVVAILQMLTWLRVKYSEEVYEQIPGSDDGLYVDEKTNDISVNNNTSNTFKNKPKKQAYIDLEEGVVSDDLEDDAVSYKSRNNGEIN